jgi:hypothetical protein
MSLFDPSRIEPRDRLIIGVLLIIGVWLWHESVVRPNRLLDEVCERASGIDLDKAAAGERVALDEMQAICRNHMPIDRQRP